MSIRPDANTRYVRYRFGECRAMIAGHHPGTPQWRHQFWLKEGVIAGSELGMVLLGAFALWHLTHRLAPPDQLAADSVGLTILLAYLFYAIRQLRAKTRTLRDQIHYYTTHQITINAQILSHTVKRLASWSISENQLIAAGLLPEQARASPFERPRNPSGNP